ncbi:MAG: CHASE2 domain-containing protein [Proteobacteria bacterium]|nr:CHASE2 domain-containing protein [Pseudomonadota bacterium]
MVKKILLSLIVGLLTFCLIQFISTQTTLFTGMERSLLNGFYYVREPGVNEFNRRVSNRVILLGYDDKSLAAIGKWPWKRYVHAGFLDKIEQFSPETVMFDIMFIKPESIPDYISEKTDLDPQTRRQVESAFVKMDKEFETSLKRYDNVYLDLQLIETPRQDLPEDYQARILFNESIIQGRSQPANNNKSLILFHSLEPILSGYVENAHPVVINVVKEDDGVIRYFPLYYTYQMNNGSYRNIFTVVLSLLQRYYYVEMNDVIIGPGKVTLKLAKAPVLDTNTDQERVSVHDFETVSGRIRNPKPPESYRYNKNLYNFLVSQVVLYPQDVEKLPYFPLRVLQKEDNSLQILDGWEIYDAALRVHSRKIDLIFYTEKDIEIKTPLTGLFRINYAGGEERLFLNPDTGKPQIHHTIPTGSYVDVYALDSLPDIPPLNNSGELEQGVDTRNLENWFFRLCVKKSQDIYKQARQELGEQVEDNARLRQYMNRHPGLGKYFFYYLFFANVDPKPGMLNSLIEMYPDFGKEIGQDPAYFLSIKQILLALTESYRQQFDRYYNKFVFTGANATGLGDVRQTPYGAMTGVNIIMNAFNTVVTQHPLRTSTDVPRLDFLLLLGICLCCSLLYGLTNIRISSIIFVLLFLATFATALVLFRSHDLFLVTTPLVFSNAIIFVSIVIFKVLTEEKDRKFLKATFSSYLAPELIDEMYKSKTIPSLGGEARPITAFFTDIQGFSTFSEKLTAHQLVELLNEYLSNMTDILIADKGTLDKYEGDAIIAFFGAPMEIPDHSFRACRVGVAMQNRLRELGEKWRNEKQKPDEPDRNSKGLPPEEWEPGDKWPKIVHQMKMRIGINTGEIVVGNMGSSMRMNYTMMGDPVNLAARLEEAGKQYGVYMLVSENTLASSFIDENGYEARVSDMLEARFIDNIAVVGKSEPVKVYEVWAMKGGLTKEEQALVKTFDEGMQHYLKMEWDEAVAKFSDSLKIERIKDGKTIPSEVYIQRCKVFKENPPAAPGEEWDCICRLTKK